MARENSGNWQVNVWQQTKVQTWTRFWEPMGIWNGRARYWVNSSFLCSRSPTRDLGNQTSAWVHWTWHCNNFWQVLAILQPKWCRLHPPDGQPFGKLCWHLYWSTQQHHRGTQGVKLKGSQRQWMGPWKPNYQVTLMSWTGVNFIQRQTRETDSITCCPTYQRWFHWTKFTWFKSK